MNKRYRSWILLVGRNHLKHVRTRPITQRICGRAWGYACLGRMAREQNLSAQNKTPEYTISKQRLNLLEPKRGWRQILPLYKEASCN